MERENQFEEFEAIDLSSLELMLDSFPQIVEPDPQEETEEIDSVETAEETIENHTDDKPEEPSSQDTKDSSPLTPYAKMLVEEGLLPNIDLSKFDGTVESLLEAQRLYDEERFNSFKESALDPRVKWLQDNLEQGVPLNRLLEIEQQKFEINNITEETLSSNEDLQKNVLRNYYYETTNFSAEKVEKVIERLETLGELGEESKSSLQDLKTIIANKEQNAVQQAQIDKQNSIKQQEEALKTFKDTLNSKQEIVPGVKVSQLVKDKIFKTLTTPVGVDQSTGVPLNKIAQARAEDPLNFEINLAYIFEITNGFKDWSTLGMSGKKSAISEFEKSVKDIDLNKNTYKRPVYNQETKSYLEEMERISKSF